MALRQPRISFNVNRKRSYSCHSFSSVSKLNSDFHISNDQFDNTFKPKSFWTYLINETGSTQDYTSHKNDNAILFNLIYFPWRLEQLIVVGFFLCLDIFLFFFTSIPLRVLISIYSSLIQHQQLSNRQRCDIFRFFLIFGGAMFLSYMDMSRAYHYIRVQNMLQIFLIYLMVQIFNRLCSAFGEDIIDATLSSISNLSMPLPHILLDIFLCCVYVIVHSLVLFVQVITLNVSINSQTNSLLALLITDNFRELRKVVFKRCIKETLFQIVCGDIVERFHLFIFLLIIIIQNLIASEWEIGWDFIRNIFIASTLCFIFEVFTDWLKHGFIIKFSRLDVNLYRVYHEILVSSLSPSRNDVTLSINSPSFKLGFVGIPLSCLLLRVLFRALRSSNGLLYKIFLIVLLFLCLFTIKLILSICLLAHSYRIKMKSKMKNNNNIDETAKKRNTSFSPIRHRPLLSVFRHTTQFGGLPEL